MSVSAALSYDVILFDADDTLLDFARSEASALETTLTEFGFHVPLDEFVVRFKEINKGVWREYEAGRLTSREIRVRRFMLLLDEFGRNKDPEDMSSFYVEQLSQASFLMDGARELLTELFGSVPLGLVTNGIGQVQRSRLARSGLTDFFDAIIISEEIGIQKPDPEAFRMALESLGAVVDDRVIMVGDGLGSDIKGAIAAGIDCCWINPDPTRQPPSDIVPTQMARDLYELRPILGLK